MKIVILEAKSLGDDISFTSFEQFGEVKVYPNTTVEEMPERIRDAEILVANKLPLNRETLKDAPKVRMVGLSATGINNLDGEYLKSRGIAAYHVAGYSTEAVAQHTFALLLYLMERLRYYDDFVKSGQYSDCGTFSWFGEPFMELAGKTWGILGMGAIGRKVAQIAEVFGCRVICCSASGGHYDTPYRQVEWKELLASSDILSVHAPLNSYTEGLMNREAFRAMKPSAYFINVARGPVVDDAALAEALREGWIAGAALDVVSKEPVPRDNPLLEIQDSRKLVITPHIGWAPVETRRRCAEETAANIGRFLRGDHVNRVY